MAKAVINLQKESGGIVKISNDVMRFFICF